ncbi:MAG: ChbG/HpnK family deacetylase [Proteobacteria bacterium]|nr:ChbG/HpnK family deacetylase [Pseudomonadota bacterium]
MNPAPRARHFWLCADDYGMAPGINTAIRDLIVRARINATSVMVATPSFNRSEALSLGMLNIGAHRVAIGLHLVLTAPFAPLSSGFSPLRAGRFPTLSALLRAALLRRLDKDALAREIEAQIDAFAAAFGRLPDFIDGHQHVHIFPQVRDCLLRVAKRRTPDAWLRQCGRVVGIGRRLADRKGLLLDAFSRAFRRRAARAGMRTNAAFAGTYHFRSRRPFARRFAGFLDLLPEHGLVMCHPGFVDGELRRLDALTSAREKEHAFFASEEFPLLLAKRGLTLFGETPAPQAASQNTAAGPLQRRQRLPI